MTGVLIVISIIVGVVVVAFIVGNKIARWRGRQIHHQITQQKGHYSYNWTPWRLFKGGEVSYIDPETGSHYTRHYSPLKYVWWIIVAGIVVYILLGFLFIFVN